jgi:hypothetical protein
LKQDWFQNNYEYLYNRVLEYRPQEFFLKEVDELSKDASFLSTYKFFNLKKTEEIKIMLREEEVKCYKFYKSLIRKLRNKVRDRLENLEMNIYDIKAPSNWLKELEEKYGVSRQVFKDFLYEYDLPNLPLIIEDIKGQCGIAYNGGNSFKIAKERSSIQEAFWENKLKKRFGEDVSAQFKYGNCIFDFINIKTNTIYECKLNLRDFNEEQFFKYNLILNTYKIIYLISENCVIDLSCNKLYCEDLGKYEDYKMKIPLMKKKSRMDELIEKIDIIHMNDASLML